MRSARIVGGRNGKALRAAVVVIVPLSLRGVGRGQ